MIRLIISDIDGTLVPEGGSNLNPEYLTVIRDLTELGVQFALASGRQTSSIDVLFHEVRDLVYYLGDNGASIRKGGASVKELRLNREQLDLLMEELKEIPGHRLLFSTRDGYYTDDPDETFGKMIFGEYKGRGKAVDDITPYLGDSIKLSLYCEGGARGIFDQIYDRWKDRFAIHVSGAKWVDINAPEATKGRAVQWIQETQGITPEETVVFGDNYNDISMMMRAERSYASELSGPDIRKAAGRVMGSWQKDGVLKVLKQIREEIKSER